MCLPRVGVLLTAPGGGQVVLRESLGQWIRVPRAGVHVVLGRFPGGGKSGWLQMPGGKPGPRRAGLHGVCCLSPALGQVMSGTRKNQVWDFWFENFLRSFQDFPSHCRYPASATQNMQNQINTVCNLEACVLESLSPPVQVPPPRNWG